ncbi:MAG: hypothetical protein CR972_02795 [Candidatus Moraniibacteriota bacterium]|nr:MAG: hypothetical protein CR972_02795 [Candidatus Moranbacteria bacterium]
MYYFSVISIFIFSAFFLPISVIAGNGEEIEGKTMDVLNVVYDYEHQKEYQVDGNSMATLGFPHESFVNVVPASDFHVGDVIAFTCTHEKCDGAYIKRITRKQGSCYWVEGRRDKWKEDGRTLQSMDSRTSYGWLCNDDIDIMGVAFPKSA